MSGSGNPCSPEHRVKGMATTVYRAMPIKSTLTNVIDKLTPPLHESRSQPLRAALLISNSISRRKRRRLRGPFHEHSPPRTTALRLVTSRGRVQLIVIDRTELPTANKLSPTAAESRAT